MEFMMFDDPQSSKSKHMKSGAPVLFALFVRIKIDGIFRPWRFEGFLDSMTKIQEVAMKIVAENGPDSFRLFELPGNGQPPSEWYGSTIKRPGPGIVR